MTGPAGPLDPLALAACVSAALCAVAWFAVCWRRAGLFPARWLSALTLALFVACVPAVVEDMLALASPPDYVHSDNVWEVGRILWRFQERLQMVGPLTVLLPLAAGVGCGRARRSWLHGLAEAATWAVVTLPLAWLWYLAWRPIPFHSDSLYVTRELIVDLAIGPYVALAAGVCAVILRRLARRCGPPARLHWIALGGPLALLAALPYWRGYFHARAELPALDRHWCRFVARTGVALWPAAPELCGGRERIDVWCRSIDMASMLWQEPSGIMHVDAGDEAVYAAIPGAEALRPVFADTWKFEARGGRSQRTAGFWPSPTMTGAELAAWLSLLQAVGVERVELFAAIEYVEDHPRHPLLRRSGCPLGRLDAGDVDVVRTWERLDRALLDGRLPALQRGRPEFPLRGAGSAREREAEAAMASWPK